MDDPTDGDEPESGRPSGRLIGKRSRTAPPDPPGAAQDAWEDVPTLAGPPPPDEPSDVPVPDRLGPYEIEGEIARGGMGIVLKGFHTRLQRRVAIKLLRPDVAADEVARERFLREARAAARLRHAGIVAVHDVTEDEAGRSYLVMDYVEGESLKEVVRRGALAPRRTVEILEKVCLAVAHAHEHGILHRDLKPDNILIDGRSREPLLTDFGLAKLVTGARDSTRRRRSLMRTREETGEEQVELTLEGEVMGTPLYMAPEQIDPDLGEIGPETDVYALGAILYECLVGRPPFLGRSAVEVLEAALDRSPTPPRHLNPLVPASLEAMALRCLSKRPRERYGSAAELGSALERYHRQTSTPDAPVLRVPPPAQDRSAWASVVLLCLLAGGVAYLALGPGLRGGSGEAARTPDEEPPAPSPPSPLTSPSWDWLPDPTEFGDAGGIKLAPEQITRQNVLKLAQEGYVDAMLRLGEGILQGELPEHNREEGLAWIERAARAGLPRAFLVLAHVYEEGIGVEGSRDQAIRWLRQGAEQDVRGCAFQLGYLLLSRTDGDPKTQAEARRWLKEAAREEPERAGEALLLLGQLLARGELGERQDAISTWERAAELGSVGAMLELAVAHQQGKIVAKDKERALSWLKRAAATEHPQALFNMGKAHELGLLGLPPSAKKARACYRKAVEAGHEEAAFRLKELGAE